MNQNEISQYTMKELKAALNKRYGRSRDGSTRSAWLTEDKAIKLPRLSKYSKLNEIEYAHYVAYQSGNSDIPIASCELCYTKDGVAIVIMDRVTVVKSMDQYPTWTRKIDTRQVGYNKAGELVCYDHTTE